MRKLRSEPSWGSFSRSRARWLARWFAGCLIWISVAFRLLIGWLEEKGGGTSIKDLIRDYRD